MGNTNTPDLRIDLPWLMILQQKAQFDLAFIYLCLCVATCSYRACDANACAVMHLMQLKPPFLSLALARCSAIFGPPDHSILSSPCGRCFADGTTWILQGDLQQMKEQRELWRHPKNADGCTFLVEIDTICSFLFCFWCSLWHIFGCVIPCLVFGSFWYIRI